MSVVDDNKLKLLKMKEKLLEVSVGTNNYNALNDYQKIACEIDKEMYKSITDTINNNKEYLDYSLEKQLETFISIEKEYNDYQSFQESIRNVYKKYTDKNLELCDINAIKIEEIRKRISSIEKYLENLKKIENNKEKLDELNGKLIDIEKKLTVFKNRVNELDEDLRQNILKAEGRIYNQHGDLEYTSAILETEKIGIDLKTMLSNPAVLKQKITVTKEELKEVNERLKTAEICYNSRPNINYKDVYFNIKNEAISIQYKLTLLEIIELLSDNAETYDESIEKRNKLIDLKKQRVDLLKQLDIKYLYDPFDRIHIKKQLEIIEAYGNNLNNSKGIIKQIGEVSNDNDNRINENRDLMEYLKTRNDLLNDNTPLANIIEREAIDSENIQSRFYENQVINIVAISPNFMLARAREKAVGVINRVYEMVNETSNTENNNQDMAPQLVIEPVTQVNVETQQTENGMFLDLPFEIYNMSTTDEPTLTTTNTTVNDNIFMDLPFEESMDKKVDTIEISSLSDSKDNVDITTNSTQPEIQLFQEVQPFDDVSLFDDRYDDGVIFAADNNKGLKLDLSNSTSKNNTLINNITSSSDVMPDVFWTTKDESSVSEASFDEQVEALVPHESVKTKKLVS